MPPGSGKLRGPAELRLYFHPQRGAIIAPTLPRAGELRYRGGRDADWSDCGAIKVRRSASGVMLPRPEQALPGGFVWGDPARQLFGMGGPSLVFGPLEKCCRRCKRDFTFTAAEQKHWYETLGFHLDSRAVECQPCRAARRRLESSRKSYATALAAAAQREDAQAQLEVAVAALAVLEAGGRVPLDKAIAHARRALRRGGGAEAEQALAALQAQRRPR